MAKLADGWSGGEMVRDARTQQRAPARGHALTRVAGFLFGGTAAFLAAGFAIFSTHVSHLASPTDLPRADAIIVLTGGQARIDTAVDLLEDGKGERLLISGVHPAAGRAALSRATGGDARLFSCCVDIDYAALDTIGNAEQSAKWVQSHGYHRVILVTNNYHMPRSLLELRRLIGDEAELLPYPVVNTPLDEGRWLTRPDTLRVLATEYAKYIAALARGALPQAEESGRGSQTAAVPAESVRR